MIPPSPPSSPRWRFARPLRILIVGGIAALAFLTIALDPSSQHHTRNVPSHSGKKPNRLINEKSPYLLQHAYNPVDWYPWGEEAFEKARREDKPIFLSIGYSTCYWCHVMEREVFENDSIAALMNDKLVCIKVDREERPDIDRVYMGAVQAMTGGGGWPMSVFLTHDLKPFFGATYIPPKSQYGRPGFPDIVNRISEIWKTNRDTLLESSNQITEYLKSIAGRGQGSSPDDSLFDTAFRQYTATYDSIHGGFGDAPKFPRPVSLNFLLRYYVRTGNDAALQMTLATLRGMANGGVYDHIGGGFHRYSVDGGWRVPHFEKMLYDQAQLAVSYLEAFQITHESFYADVARDILSYMTRNLRDKDGGFYSAEDAESAPDPSDPNKKEEGACYLWTKTEITAILGEEQGAIFNFHYGVEDSGNAPHDPMNVFSGKNILYIAHPLDETAKQFGTNVASIRSTLDNSRGTLFARRETRPKPHLDDKIITAWNGLAISAFAKAYQVLGDEHYLAQAEAAARFGMTHLYSPKSQTLFRRFRDGEARFEGTLQDYAFLVQGLIDLYEASFKIEWLQDAIMLTAKQNGLFWDSSAGGYFDVTANDPSILIRTKEDYDGAEPTGNSVAALNLLRLASITDNHEWRLMASKTIDAFGLRLQQMPEAAPQMLVAFGWQDSTPKEIIIAGTQNSASARELLAEVHSHFIPNKILLLADGGSGQQLLASYLPFIKGMQMKDNRATAYVCENYACQLPTTERSVVAELLAKKAGRQQE